MPTAPYVTVIGIDPGKAGGIAVGRSTATSLTIDVTQALNKLTEQELVEFLVTHSDQHTHCTLEKVWAGPKMASSSAFKFGLGFGVLVGALTATGLQTGVQWQQVAASSWQAKLKVSSKGRKLGDKDSQKKRELRAACQRMFPKLKVTNATCDAVLIAAYTHRNLRGML